MVTVEPIDYFEIISSHVVAKFPCQLKNVCPVIVLLPLFGWSLIQGKYLEEFQR